MSSPAIDSLEEAYEDTKDILLPFNFRTWSVFAIIILLAGNFSFPTTSVPGPGDGIGDDFDQPGLDGDQVPETGIQFQDGMPQLESLVGQNYTSSSSLWFLGGIAALIGVIIALFMLIGSIFKFVLFRSVKDKNPSLGFAKTYLKPGAKYFAYKLSMTLIFLGLAGILFYLFFQSQWILAVITLIVGIFAFVTFLAVDWIISNLTLPEMIYEEKGLVESFKTSLSLVRDNIGDVIVFWLLKLIVGSALAIGVFIMLLVIGLIFAVPLILLGIVLASISIYLVVPVALIGFVLGIGLFLYVSVPIQVFVHSYILNFYEDIRN